MEKADVAISREFLKAYARIPKSAQKKVEEFLTKFENDPRSPGINYEKINNARDDSFRSVRMGIEYRGIVKKPDTGNVFFLLWVDKHDDAYDWATKHCFRQNTNTRGLQVVDVSTMNEPLPSASTSRINNRPNNKLVNLSDNQLLKLGVPPEKLDVVKSLRTDDDLEYIEEKLPIDAYEAIYMAAAGTAWEDLKVDYVHPFDTTLEVNSNLAAPHSHLVPPVSNAVSTDIETNEIEAALASPESQRSFYVVDNASDLQSILAAPLEHWRIFLHPTQCKLVNKHWAGPVRVLGGAGTGKTVAAIHRAAWLVRNVLDNNAHDKVLFTTFTSNLALDIEHNLNKICNSEEQQRIEVKHIDRWIEEFLASRNYKKTIVYPGTGKHYDDYWAQAIKHSSEGLGQPETFYTEEWERVILPQRIQDKPGYFRASRTGRGVPLSRAQRAEIWPVFQKMQELLEANQSCTYEDATLDATDMLKSIPLEPIYRSIVVDETQDMGPEALTLLRQLAPEQDNDIFLVGDGHQRIYRRKAVMSQCGIKIVGRSRKLRINYRTTEEIRRFATAVIEDVKIDDMDGELDTTEKYHSLTRGIKPTISLLQSLPAESAHIAKEITALQNTGVKLQDICVAVRTKRLRSDLAKLLQSNGIVTHSLERHIDDQTSAGVRMATMHRIKGLEFRYVFVAAVNEGIVPLTSNLKSTEDIVEARALDVNERALLHVAATRAITGLYISTSGPASPYLEGMV